MNNYNVLARKVMDFLDENNYNSCTRRGIKSCFKLLGRYLEQSGYEYTPETADEWFRLIEPDTSVTYAAFYRSALTKLRDMFETGDIRDCNNGKTYAYTRLREEFKSVYEAASAHFQESLSVLHLRVISITGGISSFFSSRKGAEASRIFLMTTWPDSTTVLHTGRKMTGNIH